MKINLPRLFFTNIYILILNNCNESFIEFLFILLNSNQFTDKNFNLVEIDGKMSNFSKISTSPFRQVS